MERNFILPGQAENLPGNLPHLLRFAGSGNDSDLPVLAGGMSLGPFPENLPGTTSTACFRPYVVFREAGPGTPGSGTILRTGAA